MRATPLTLLLLLAIIVPGQVAGQERRTGFSDEQWRHWAVKVGAAAGTYETLRVIDASPDFSALVATTAPTVIGKLMYMPHGLSDDPARRWPNSTFVLRDVVGELCVQSAPLWMRLFVSGPKDERIVRGLLAVGGYGLAVFTCARTLEVR